MAYEVVPAVQAVLDVFPEKKKDGFDRVMDVAHLIMDGHSSAAVIRQNIDDNLVDLLFQTIDEFGRIVGLVLDVSELFFPDTGQLTALQEFLVDGVDEFDTCWSCHQVLALAADVVALEESLDDAGTG